MKVALLSLCVVLTWWIFPFWLQGGMFMDGQIYAAVAQNLADGIGTFWAPVYQPSAAQPYSEQLPLFMGMESLLFRLFGDTLWVERIFMAAAWVATAWGISAFQRCFWPERGPDTALWVVTIWSSAPLVGWGMGNHVQEMWMAPFTLWAVVAMTHKKWVWIAGLLVMCSALFKGPQGLFPLVWLPILGAFGVLQKAEVRRRVTILLGVGLLLGLGLLFWDDAREAIIRNAENRLVRTFTQERAVTTNDRLWLLGPMLGQLAVLVGSSLVAAFIRFGTLRVSVDRRVIALVGLGLVASIPLMITHEQRDFYLITSLPFMALGLVNALVGTPIVRSVNTSVALSGFAVIGICLLPWRSVERDAVLRASLAKVHSQFEPRTAFNTSPELRLNHELAAYAMRLYRWEVDLSNKLEHPYRMVPDSTMPGAVLIEVHPKRSREQR
ncbi:MAG: ArnT family glycosyltransferase [Schleiferiaceae bacterium]